MSPRDRVGRPICVECGKPLGAKSGYDYGKCVCNFFVNRRQLSPRDPLAMEFLHGFALARRKQREKAHA